MKLIIYFFFGFLFVQQNALGVESPIHTLSKLNDQFHINDLDHLQSSTEKEIIEISYYKPTDLMNSPYNERTEGYSLVIAKKTNGKVVRRLMTGDYTAIWIRGSKKAIRGKISEISRGSVWIEDREIAISEIEKINRKEYSPFKKGLFAAGGLGSLALGTLFTSDTIRSFADDGEKDGYSSLATVIGACMAILLLALGVLLLSRFKKYRSRNYEFLAKSN
ncbi:MAG: hypothetical protein AAF388_21265 [Bacteroidota bacterium]